MFLIGGINGAFSASVPVDFALHDTYWVVAHLHYVLFGGSVFGDHRPGFYYWFPKMTGRMMNETLGKIQFVLMFIGFNLTFFPMHELGLAGMPRRIADYASIAGWNDLNLARHDRRLHDRRCRCCRSCGTSSSRCAAARRRATTRGRANTLEWATTSPPPPYNFDRLPEIRSERPLFDPRHGRRPSTEEASDDDAPTPRADHHRAQPGRGVVAHDARGGSATRSSGCCCSSPPR